MSIYQESPYTVSYPRKVQRRLSNASKVDLLKDSMKDVSRQYCAESSIGGLKHLVNKDTPSFERIIWILALISAIVCSVSLVYLNFKKYYTAPLVTTQMPEGVSVSNIIFPAVGICSNNRISKRAVTELARNLLKEERNRKYNESEMLKLLMGLGHLYNQMQPTDEGDIQPMRLHEALGEYDVAKLMKDLTPRCEDLLVTCAWNDAPKDCEDLFDFRKTMNGYCCTFNYLRPSDEFESQEQKLSIESYKYGNKSSFDFDYGLKVLLRLNESDDFYYNLPLQGAQMTVTVTASFTEASRDIQHVPVKLRQCLFYDESPTCPSIHTATLQFSDAYDFPDAPSGSFALQIISPNVQMTVTVTASFTEASRDIQHVPVKLRQCLFYDESPYLPFYTHSDCMLKCRMLFLLENCNCTPFTMPRMANVRVCNIKDVLCLRVYFAQSIAVLPEIEKSTEEISSDLLSGGISCPMCYPTCSKTAYNYDFYNVHIYPEYLNDVPDENRDHWLQGANFNGTSIVHVKYGREVADCFEQNVITKWFDLISNIGSTCGFVTGFSFVSVLEFFYFFTVKLVREMRARKAVINKVTNLDGRKEEPLARFQPLYWNELTAATRSSRGIPID